MFNKITFIAAAAAAAIIYATDINAGPFLTLEMGGLSNSYEASTCKPDGTININDASVVDSVVIINDATIGCADTKTLGDSGWIGSIRAGWETRHYRVAGPVYIKGHGVFQHISDPKVGDDGGVEFVAIGFTLTGKPK